MKSEEEDDDWEGNEEEGEEEQGMKRGKRKESKRAAEWLEVYLEKTGCWLCVGGAPTVLQAGHVAHKLRGSCGWRQSHEGSGQQVRPHLNDLHQKVGSDESRRKQVRMRRTSTHFHLYSLAYTLLSALASGEVAGQAVTHINSRLLSKKNLCVYYSVLTIELGVCLFSPGAS